MRLTEGTVSELELPPGKSELIVFDDKLAGFGIRLRSGGSRTWIAQYRIGNKQRREKLGTFPNLKANEAREAARRTLNRAGLGYDPQAEKIADRAKAKNTIDSIIDDYLAFKADKVRARTHEETERYLRKHWKPLHRMQIDKIELADVAACLRAIIRTNGEVAALRARVALSNLFVWAMREGIAKSNPVINTNKPDEPEARDRVLSEGEIAEIWAACRDDDYGRIVKLALLTAARRDEVSGMLWDEIAVERATWSIPGDRTKNGRPLVLPLSATALEILKNVNRRENRVHVFGAGEGGFSGWSKAKAALDVRILEARQKKDAKAKAMKDWRFHDLRRTCATIMADKLGVLPHVIEAVLNHVSGHKAGVAGVYNRALYEREMRDALTRLADYVEAVIDGRDPKVVPLHGGQMKFPA
jgi:integrase